MQKLFSGALALSIALSLSATTALAVSVDAHRPSAHALSIPQTDDILIRFTDDVDPATFTDTSFRVFGRFSGPVTGTIQIQGNRLRFTPDRTLAPGDWITVHMTTAITGMLGDPLTNPYSFNFWTASAPAGMTFTPTGLLNPGDVPYGAHGGDIDHDGDLDLAVPNEGSDDMAVYLNDGTGSYGPRTSYPAGSVPSSIEAMDLNLDGHVDLVVGNTQSADISVFMGNGDGTFQPEMRNATGDNPRGIGWTDLDADGDFDLVIGNRGDGFIGPSDVSILIANGDGTFAPENRVDPPGDGETAVVATDVNGDGLEDLIIGNHESEDVRVFLATAPGSYTFGSVADAGGSVWQMAVGDMNGDGLLDVVTANSNTSSAGVLLAAGPGILTDAVTYDTASFPLAIDVGDLDGDGDLDLVTSNFSGGTWTVYRNDGNGALFDRQELPASVSGSCAVLHDRDKDGDLDITAIDELFDEIVLYRND